MNYSNRLSVFKRLVGAFTVSAVILTPLSALALANPTPDQHWTAPNSGDIGESVRAVVAASDGSYYVAGDFIDYSTSYGSAVLANASTGLAESPFPDVDGQVNTAISDGAGGWYIAGDFNRVGPLQRSYLAHVNADGTADVAFDADAVRTCGMCNPAIHALALDEDDNILYVGGNSPNFEFGGTTADGLIALDATDGSVDTDFTPPFIGGDDQVVYALALDETNNQLLVGGSFTTINGSTARNNLAGFIATSGAVTSFDPDVNNDVLTLALNTINGYVYVGGIFTMVNGATLRNRVALINSTLSTANADPTFDADADGTAVNTLALDSTNGFLYVGGNFANIGGQPRNRLAQLYMGDGSATAGFNPDLDDYVLNIALNADGSELYAVGAFTYADPLTARDGIAAYDTSDGSVLPFDQSLQEAPTSIALSVDEESVLIGTEGNNNRADDNVYGPPPFGGTVRILHVMSDGTVDPDFPSGFPPGGYTDGPIYAMALSPDESVLYIGGDFTCVGAFIFCDSDYPYLAALDATTGMVVSVFQPQPNDAVRALAVSHDVGGDTLYAGGDFSTVNGGTTRDALAAFTTANGLVTAFNADISGGTSVNALALTSDDSVLYIGGDFTSFFGPNFRNNLAAATTAGTGAPVMTFDPDVDDAVYALTLSPDESEVFAGGNFQDVNSGTTRNYAAAFNAATGVATAFDPDVNSNVNALAFGPDGILYMGGDFDDTDHEYITAVDPDTGAPDAGFKTNLSHDVFALAHGGTGNGLLAGGDFSYSFQDDGGSEIPYVVTVNLAHYDDTSTPTPTPTPTPSGGGSHSSGGGGYLTGFSPSPMPTPTPIPGAPGHGDPANLARYGLHEGDVVGAPAAGDPDVYIVNEWGYKRLFLNPVIFSFYGHLKFSAVHDILPPGRDAFPVSGLFRNCEANDPKVYAVEVTGEDTGFLHHVNISGDAAVAQDPDFFHKVFCINNREFDWYPKSTTPYTSLSQVPMYRR